MSKTGYIPESIKAVFKGLKEKGILTGIATGRGYYGVVEDIRDLEPDYFVTINGTYVINRKGEEIYNQPLAREVTEAFVWCREIGIAWGFAGKDKPVVSERSDLIDDAMKPVYGLCDVEPDFHFVRRCLPYGLLRKMMVSLSYQKNLRHMFVWYLGTNTHLTS